jgi:hypothetical protein
MDQTPDSEYLFPRLSPRGKKPYIGSLKKVWGTTLRRAGVRHFSIYGLRHTFAARLSAGGVSGSLVAQMLRQGDAQVFKRYSQAKLAMTREARLRLTAHVSAAGGGPCTRPPSEHCAGWRRTIGRFASGEGVGCSWREWSLRRRFQGAAGSRTTAAAKRLSADASAPRPAS